MVLFHNMGVTTRELGTVLVKNGGRGRGRHNCRFVCVCFFYYYYTFKIHI